MGQENATHPQLEKLAELIGEFIQYWGFKRVHGRIWTHLFLAHEPLDAGDLIRRLKISKALVSMSLADLLEFNVIVESGKSSRGTLLYRANPAITDVITQVLVQRERKLLERIKMASEDLRKLEEADLLVHNINGPRIQKIVQMSDEANTCLTAIVALYQIDFGGWKQFNS